MAELLRSRIVGRLPLLAAIVLVLAYYACIPSRRVELSSDYYPSLARAFLQGRLDLGRKDECVKLASLRDPYDAYENARIRFHGRVHDLSYYNGRLYMYFGPTPAVLAFVPWRLLFGADLDSSRAGLAFAWVGFLANAWLLLSLLSVIAPGLAQGRRAALVFVLGFATWCPVVLRRLEVYEVAVLCAYALASIGMACLWRYLRHGQRGWLVGCALSFGLMLGARPSLVLLGLCPPLAILLRRAGLSKRDPLRRTVVDCASTAGILAGCLALLLWYNQARFGNLLEFGTTYQLSELRMRGRSLFSWSRVALNLFAYLFSTPHLADHFPFIMCRGWQPIELGGGGVVTYVVEGVCSVVLLSPVCLFAMLAWLRLRRATMPAVGGRMLLVLAVACAAAFATLLAVSGPSVRYLPDFSPWLMIPALIGVALVLQNRRGRVERGLARVPCWITVLCIFLYSAQYHGLMRQTQPAAFRLLAGAANLPVAWAESLYGLQHGPVEVEFQVSRQPEGRVEVLIGAEGASMPIRPDRNEYFAIEYLSGDMARFYFVRDFNVVLFKSDPVLLAPDATHRLTLGFGALYPQSPHPRFDDVTLDALANRSFLEIDGRTVIEAYYPRMEAFGSHPRFGSGPEALELAPFSGKVIVVRRPSAWPAPAK
jgi:hypothetical protein